MAFAAATEPISVKLRKDERGRFTAVCDEIGASPSNAIRIFDSAFSHLGGSHSTPRIPAYSVPRRSPWWMTRRRAGTSPALTARRRRPWSRSTRTRP